MFPRLYAIRVRRFEPGINRFNSDFLYLLLTTSFGGVNFNGLSYKDSFPFKRNNMPRKSLDQQLQIIRDELLLLSSMVETALVESVSALKDHDMERSRTVYENDVKINAKRFDLEGQIIVTIAIQAPVLHDLRFLASALNICTELERIGDYAKAIARINLMSEGISVPRLLNMTYEMGVKTSDMLHRSMTVFSHTNVPYAVRAISDDDMISAIVRIISDDDTIDGMYNKLYSEVMEFVIRGAHDIERANYLFWVAHNLERAGDRVTNICERTIYVETGELSDMMLSNPRLPK
jgi:phosphate transport system protein